MYCIEPRNPVFYTANPQTTIQLKSRHPHVPVVDIWKVAWGRLTSQFIPSVHPWAVTGYVLGAEITQPLVVVYIQPHFPAIGQTPLAMGQWATTTNEFSRVCRRELIRPEKMHKAGRLNLKQFRRAYADNVRAAIVPALHLACRIPGKVIITSDHGEALGEEDAKTHIPRFGHSDRWSNLDHILRQVPWVEIDGDKLRDKSEDDGVKQRLVDLGYM
jgi:hypothetical protein